MSYYEIRKKMIVLSNMLVRAKVEKRSRAVIDRLQGMIGHLEEEFEECEA